MLFWHLPKYVTYAKILVHVRDHVRRFYGNCEILFLKILQYSEENTCVGVSF